MEAENLRPGHILYNSLFKEYCISFWPNRAKLCFTQAEAQFDIKGITVSKKKFSHALTMLDAKTADFVMDLLWSHTNR